MKEMVLNALTQYIESLPQGKLKHAVEYALMAGGKRLRPLLMLSVLEDYGYDPTLYTDVAIALEMIHTYSLIHDDLPAMDNDTLRRGKPTLHIAFDEGLAILAGDTLLTDSFDIITKHATLTDKQKIDLVSILSMKSGSHGMILGQVEDLDSEGKQVTLDALEFMYERKTSYLLQASLMMGAAIASPQDLSAWETLGHDLGILFQIQDDVLELTSSVETLGKSKTDELREKPTYVSLTSLADAEKRIETLSSNITTVLKSLSLLEGKTAELIDLIKKRNH